MFVYIIYMQKFDDIDMLEDSNGWGTMPDLEDPVFSNQLVPPPEPVPAPRILNITTQQTNGRDQNALKISISVMHKILKGRQRNIRTARFIQLLQEANRYKNYATPVKFIILAQRSNLISVLKEQFPLAAQTHIDALMQSKEWSEQRYLIFPISHRYKNTMICKMRVEEALNSKSFIDSLGCIWKNNNHKNKSKSSKQDVIKFNNKIKKIKKTDLINKK